MKLPNRKITNYVEQQGGGELLVYNLSTNQAFCLNQTAAEVFNACDGETSFESLEKRSNFPRELVNLTLDELHKRDLIESDHLSPFDRMKRREVIKKVGLTTVLALPMIIGLAAPTSSNAASTCPNPQATSTIGLSHAACNSFCADRCSPCLASSINYNPGNGSCACVAGCVRQTEVA